MNIKDLDWKNKYKIEVLNPEIEGIFDESRRVYEQCILESLSSSDADFSFDLDDEEFEDYADIPDENIIYITQSDIDNEYVKISIDITSS